MGRILGAIAATFAIMFLVPFPFYGGLEALGLVEMPGNGSPAEFMRSVLLIKIGVAIGFVLLFRLARPALGGRWGPWAAIWWVMYGIVEIGQAVGPGYSAWDAVGGILSEAVYFPLATLATVRILGPEE